MPYRYLAYQQYCLHSDPKKGILDIEEWWPLVIDNYIKVDPQTRILEHQRKVEAYKQYLKQHEESKKR